MYCLRDNLDVFIFADLSEDELYLQFALEQSMSEAVVSTVINDDTCIDSSVRSVADWREDTDLACAIGESIRTLRLEQIMRETTTADDAVITARQAFMVRFERHII